MKKVILISTWLFFIALIYPLRAWSFQSGGGYTVFDQNNPTTGNTTGGGFNSQAGGNPMVQKVTGNGFTSFGGVFHTVIIPSIIPSVVVPPTTGAVPSGSAGGSGLFCSPGTTGIYPNCVPVEASRGSNDLTYAQIVAATPLGRAPFRADPFPDGQIDILDFNVLMVNWGRVVADSSSQSCSDKLVADINCDGRVDIRDFNLLMVYWGKLVI